MARLVIVIAAVSIVAAACGGPTESGGGVRASDGSAAPVQATPWPNGTVGRFGVRVDPGLLARLPSSVGGLPVTESVDLEKPPLDSQQAAATVESLASAYVGTINDPDWAAVSVLRLRPEASASANYAALRDDYMTGACSQAGGVAGKTVESIGDRSVDVGRCAGGANTYTVRLDSRTLLTVLELGSRRLGRQLIEAVP